MADFILKFEWYINFINSTVFSLSRTLKILCHIILQWHSGNLVFIFFNKLFSPCFSVIFLLYFALPQQFQSPMTENEKSNFKSSSFSFKFFPAVETLLEIDIPFVFRLKESEWEREWRRKAKKAMTRRYFSCKLTMSWRKTSRSGFYNVSMKFPNPPARYSILCHERESRKKTWKNSRKGNWMGQYRTDLSFGTDASFIRESIRNSIKKRIFQGFFILHFFCSFPSRRLLKSLEALAKYKRFQFQAR